jgi:hypothetical protein
MRTPFGFAKGTAEARATPKKTGKKRGSNPPGARTRNEPPKVPEDFPWPREVVSDAQFTYMKPGAPVLEDTPELRSTVGNALLDIATAHQMYADAIKAFHALGQLPLSIMESLPRRQRRYLRIWKKA